MKSAPYVALLAMTGGGFAVVDLGSEVRASSIDRAGLNAHETHASSSLLGQFRTSVSSWLWLRSDLYLHNGVQMRTLSRQELAAGEKGVGGSESGREDALHDDDVIVSIVPTRDRDFRGWMGDVERAGAAWKDMKGHSHNDPEDALPLYRLMTWIDPAFTPGWMTGATVMSRRQTEDGYQKALAFLKEGLGENPSSIPILSELGRFYIAKRKNFAKGLIYLELAYKVPIDPEHLSEDDFEGLQAAYRWGALAYRELGRPEDQKRTAANGLKALGEDGVLVRLLGEPPYVLKPEAQDKWMREQIEKSADHDHEDCGHDHSHDH